MKCISCGKVELKPSDECSSEQICNDCYDYKRIYGHLPNEISTKENKFRVWCKPRNEMYYHPNFRIKIEWNGGWTIITKEDNGYAQPRENYVVMQFIHRTDNKSIDIYEEDFVLIDNTIYLIRYHQNKYRLHYFDYANKIWKPDHLIGLWKGKVVGNYFDSPKFRMEDK